MTILAATNTVPHKGPFDSITGLLLLASGFFLTREGNPSRTELRICRANRKGKK